MADRLVCPRSRSPDMTLSWTEGAIADLEHIRRYLSAIGPGAEGRLAAHLIALGDTLDAVETGPAPEVADVQILPPFLLRLHRIDAGRVVAAVRQEDGFHIR